jgi:hypothetical protein
MSVICENAQLGLGNSTYLMFTKGFTGINSRTLFSEPSWGGKSTLNS